MIDERAEQGFGHERLIARQHEDGARAVAAGAARLEERVPGAEPLLLLDVGEIGRLADGRADVVGAAADDQDYPRAERAGDPHRVVDEPPPAEQVQRLGAAPSACAWTRRPPGSPR